MPFLAVMVVTLPAIYPIIMEVGFDSIWFGVIVAMLAETGMLTPPVGTILYILQGIRPEIDFTDIIRGCTPFVLLLGVALVVLTLCPAIATWLPGLMMGR